MISSAGFVDFLAEFDNERIFLENNNQQKTFSIVVEGLLGGHSGFDIDKNRGSSHKLLAQLLLKIEDCQLIKFFGGHNFNVIPSKSQAVFTTTLPEHKLKNIVKYFYKQQKKQYKNLHIKISRQIDQSLVLKNGKEFLNFVINFSQGVLEKDGNNYVLSSQNIAEVDAEKGYLKIGIRSCNKQKEQEVVESLKGLCKNNNISFKVLDSQPAFNTLQNSILLQDLLSVANNNVKTTKCHIGVECGIFQDRIKNLDVVIVSPNIKDAHSVNERVEIQSIENLLNWLEKYLKKISQKAL